VALPGRIGGLASVTFGRAAGGVVGDGGEAACAEGGDKRRGR
jgi:hypothetical protein